MNRCVVKNCKHYTGINVNENVKFFNISKHLKLSKGWRKTFDVDIENGKICSEHFIEADYSFEQILFNISNEKKKLKKEAVPTQNLIFEGDGNDEYNKDNLKDGYPFIGEVISSKEKVMEWENWCRLCGNENGNHINIFIKKENSYSIVDIIHNFFSIEVNHFDVIPKNVCFVCNEFLKSLQYYALKVKTIEKMFVEIDLNYKTGFKIDLQQIRSKYLKNDFKNILKNNIEKQLTIKYDESINTSRGESADGKAKNIITNSNQTKNDTFSKEIKFGKILETESIFDEWEAEINNSKQLDKTKKKKLNDGNYKKNNQENKSFECEKCHLQFVRESNYAYHLKKFHNIVKPILPCNICGKMCKTKQKLKFHMELHLPAEEREKLLFKCTECDQKFTQKGAMRSHLRAKHLFEKPFICEQCGKKFASQTNLWSHRRSHDDQNHLTCSNCPKIFKNKFRLRVHMRGHNNSGNPCSVCGLVLKTMNTLKNHMLVHSETKAFECNFCGKGFKRDKNLLTHMITHSGLRPFVCRFCGQGYANRSNCKKHEKHSHLKEYEAAASIISLEPQQKVVKKLPNIQQLEVILEQIKSEKNQ